jgi:hypothetical protein
MASRYAFEGQGGTLHYRPLQHESLRPKCPSRRWNNYHTIRQLEIGRLGRDFLNLAGTRAGGDLMLFR